MARARSTASGVLEILLREGPTNRPTLLAARAAVFDRTGIADGGISLIGDPLLGIAGMPAAKYLPLGPPILVVLGLVGEVGSAFGMAVSDPVPDEGEIELGVQMAVEVVSGNELLKREEDGAVQGTHFGWAKHRDWEPF